MATTRGPGPGPDDWSPPSVCGTFNGTTITRGHYDYDKTTTSKMISSPILTSDYDKAMGYNPTMQAILDRIPKETMKEIKDMCTKHPPYLPKHNII